MLCLHQVGQALADARDFLGGLVLVEQTDVRVDLEELDELLRGDLDDLLKLGFVLGDAPGHDLVVVD